MSKASGLSGFVDQWAMRVVLVAYAAYWLSQVASHAYHGLDDATASSIVSEAFVKAAHGSEANYRNVQYLAITAMDMALPYHLLTLWTAVRGSPGFAVAVGGALVLVTALGITWKSALALLPGAEAAAHRLTLLDLLGVVALLAAFVLSRSPARQRRSTGSERVWLHLHGYVGLCVVASIFVKPAGMWIVSLNNSASTNVMYHVVMTHVFWESLLHLVVALYATDADAVAFYVAALVRVLLSLVTVYNFADHAPDVVGLTSLLVVELFTLAFFVAERFRAPPSRKAE